MEVYALVLNILLYFFTLVIILKNNGISVPAFLWGAYALTSLFCLFTYNSDPNNWSITFFPLIYLFVIILILLLPSSRVIVRSGCLSIAYRNLYRLIALFYILLSVYSCIVYFPIAWNIISNANWLEAYSDAHDAQESSILTKIANLFFHVRYLGLALFFYFCSIDKKISLFLIVLGISTILPISLVSIIHGSRGGMVILFASVVITYLLFKENLPQKIKKAMRYSTLFFIPLIALYLFTVSVSRFDDTANDLALYYLGHSMLTFDDGIYECLKQYSWGGYMLNYGAISEIEAPYSSFYGVPVSNIFHTIVGVFYLDFGLFGTFVFSILFAFLISKLRKRMYDVGDLFVLLSYFIFLFSGLFVFDKGYGVQWVETVIVYGIIKFAQRLEVSSRYNR